ncbi:VirB3 family type IV secretion system protein [Janthinobacterium sp. HH102]|uniref:VirB3 family type IV secretion system protein n=1 Tax=Janthinobacterium sp. HH102 TaxID=1537274 RepID=UPI0008FCAC5D|nr:VirB3 family type IV secretion system protein [Janthinobacterium sp. HH102]
MEELDQSTVLRAGQRPALIAYIPLSVFIAEIMVGLLLFFFIKFWVVVLLPIHLYFVIRTSSDFHWITALNAKRKFRYAKSNIGIREKGVLTFTASPIKVEKNDYADIF